MECEMSKVLGAQSANCVPCQLSNPLILKLDHNHVARSVVIYVSWEETEISCTTNQYEVQISPALSFEYSNVEIYSLEKANLINTSTGDSKIYNFDVVYNNIQNNYNWEFYFRIKGINSVISETTRWSFSKVYSLKILDPPKIISVNINMQENLIG